MDLTFWVVVIYFNNGWLPNGGGVTWISYFFIRLNRLGRYLPYIGQASQVMINTYYVPTCYFT